MTECEIWFLVIIPVFLIVALLNKLDKRKPGIDIPHLNPRKGGWNPPPTTPKPPPPKGMGQIPSIHVRNFPLQTCFENCNDENENRHTNLKEKLFWSEWVRKNLSKPGDKVKIPETNVWLENKEGNIQPIQK